MRKKGKLLNTGKSPGIDRIPNEVLKMVIDMNPELLLDMCNRCLRNGSFPRTWKKEKLVLFRKGNKPLVKTSSYRSICLLNTMGKPLEGLILQRLENCIKDENSLSRNLYGFRKVVATIDAIIEAVRIAREQEKRSGRRKTSNRY